MSPITSDGGALLGYIAAVVVALVVAGVIGALAPSKWK